jgi:hypothetical protein
MSRFQLHVLTVFLLILSFTSASHARAQAVAATLLGTTTDQSGAVVTDAIITATEIDAGLRRTTKTNGAGEYQFPNLPPGTYVLTGEHEGFEKEVRSGISLVVNTTVRIDFKFKPGKTSESVEVTADSPLLQTDRADVTAKFEAKQAEDLPLYGNDNFQTLLNLVPGVTRAVQLNTAFFNAQSALSAYVNGQSKLANNLQIEGIDDNERTGELQVYIPPAQALQTVDVNTSNYAPEFGRAAGAVTNVIFKSGTNNFHGELYEQNRIAALTARNSFNAGAVAPYVYNYFGGNIGGPIVKNRTFFFVDVLRISDHEGQFNTFTLPTMQFRSGDLSAGGTSLYDPATGTSSGTGRSQLIYQGKANVIDPARISPVAKNLLALLPALPLNAPLANNFTAINGFYKDYTSFDAKIDQNLLEQDRLSFRFSWQKVNVYQQPSFGIAGGPAAGGAVGSGGQKTYNTAANYTHPFSSSLLTEVRFGVSHYRNSETLPPGGEDLATQVGIAGANISPSTSGLSTIAITGYPSPLLGFNKNYPYTRGETDIDIVNNWTKILGQHTLKFGVEARRIRDDLGPSATFPQRGIFTYGPGQTADKLASGSSSATGIANNFASFLLDVPSQVGRTVIASQGTYRQTYYFGYAQDTWQITPKLTATYGVRWELYAPPTPSHSGGFANYDPSTNNLLVAGLGSVPKNLGVQARYNNFAPRLGLIYRASEGTVVRAGYGMSYYPGLGDGYAYDNYPNTQDTAFNPLNSYSPALSADGKTPIGIDTGFPPLGVAPLPPNGILSAPISATYFTVNKTEKTPYVASWNATVEQALPKRFVMNVAYVGNISINAPAYYNLNAATVPNTGAAGQPQFSTFGRTAATNLINAGFTSHYNSLQARFDRRFANGLGITTSFTWGKALTYATDTTALATIAYYTDIRKNRGRPGYDRAETYAQSFLYELPFGKSKRLLTGGMGARVLGGWQVAGVVTAMSGLPMTFTASATSLNAPGNTQLANIVAPFHALKGIGPNHLWFDPASFQTPGTPAPEASGLGTSSVGGFSGPGFFNLDASLQKNITLTERFVLQLKADAFGLTNTPQYSNPDTNVADGAASFGHVSASTGSRVMQFSGKLSF